MSFSSCDQLEIILKTAERCNINCTYCYFFNGGDESFKRHPKYISDRTVDELALFLEQACSEMSIQKVLIDFHGGEPLLQKKHSFKRMCEVFVKKLDKITNLSFSVQTNGILIDNEWIDLFSQFHVNIGVSLDGPKDLNDLMRKDHKGRGTYDDVVAGLRLLVSAAKSGKINKPGILSVINNEYPFPMEIYQHFVENLEIEWVDFLLPDFTHDTFPIAHKGQYSNFLSTIFQAWTTQDNPNIDIRFFNDHLKKFLRKVDNDTSDLAKEKLNSVILTIASNGDLSPADTYRLIDPALMQTGYNIAHTTLKKFLHHEFFIKLSIAENTLPNACVGCEWQNICKGGDLVHRYKKSTEFNNPSVFCDDFKIFFPQMKNYLIQGGVSEELIKNI